MARFSSGKVDRNLRDLCDIFSLRAFRSIGHLEFYFLPLDQGFVAVAGYRAVMDENILLSRLFNKAISLRVIEPLYLANSFRHHN